MGVGGKGSGTIRDDAATREDASRVFFRGGALPTGDVVPFQSSRAPFRFAWRSTPPRTGPCRGRFAARRKGGEEGGVRCQGRQARARDALGDARCGPFENRSVVRDVRERVLFPGTHRGLQLFERLRGRALRVSVPDRRERERREKRDRTLHRARHGVPLDMPPSAGGTRREKSHV